LPQDDRENPQLGFPSRYPKSCGRKSAASPSRYRSPGAARLVDPDRLRVQVINEGPDMAESEIYRPNAEK
jgi:hypothetical protein